jgi:transposase-like protein
MTRHRLDSDDNEPEAAHEAKHPKAKAPPEVPRCPWCKTAKHVQEAEQIRVFFCRKCRREFDNSEDGTIGYGSPSRRMEREERQGRRGGKKT